MGRKSRMKIKQSKARRKRRPKRAVYPMVSIATPTMDRRPFIKLLKTMILNQDYPLDKIEWVIIDDGKDKIGDVIAGMPLKVVYQHYDFKIPLGKKRNMINDIATGEFIVNMDDDDYYPPTRIRHAIDELNRTKKPLAGCSVTYTYFAKTGKVLKMGPFGPNHGTAATFAYRRDFGVEHRYNDEKLMSEERDFLDSYRIPMVQLDPLKTMVVIAHTQNTIDKDQCFGYILNKNQVAQVDTPITEMILDPALIEYYDTKLINDLAEYEPGNDLEKPEILLQRNKALYTRLDTQGRNIFHMQNQIADLQKTISVLKSLLKRQNGAEYTTKPTTVKTYGQLLPPSVSDDEDETSEDEDLVDIPMGYNYATLTPIDLSC